MAEFKLCIGDPKSGKSYQRVVSGDNAKALLGKKIGDKIRGESFDLPGYEFEITGGSDYCGFPMRKDIDGAVRKKILLVSGVGIRNKEKGIRKKKTVCGNTIHSKISLVCLKILKKGKKPLGEEEKKEEAAKQEQSKDKQSPKEQPTVHETAKSTDAPEKTPSKEKAAEKEDKKQEAQTTEKKAAEKKD